jgi:hypothetical protein
MMEKILEKELVKYFESLGLNVNMHTKARGHQGFFLKNRIDVSKMSERNKRIPTLLHEFAHYINSRLEDKIEKTGGSLDKIFSIEEFEREIILPQITKELIAVTNFVDTSSMFRTLKLHRERVKLQLKFFEEEIKEDYPDFMRSKKFKEFEKYIRRSKAKYLLKYDIVKLITPFLRREEIYTINSIEKDFPQMPKAFAAYIRLKSAQRKQARISRRINNYKKYYTKPTELFARFIEGLYLDCYKTSSMAPVAYERFCGLLNHGYYFELKNVLEMLGIGILANVNA